MKPGNKSNSAKKVESEPFPTELKSVRKHPNTYPLLELLIRGGYSCQKMGYDPFPIRFRFDFGRTLHESPPPWVKAGCPGFARNQQKLRRKTMGGSLVAGLRPEQTLSMSESTWLKAKCWLGPVGRPGRSLSPAPRRTRRANFPHRAPTTGRSRTGLDIGVDNFRMRQHEPGASV
jgi:hypothetical protein